MAHDCMRWNIRPTDEPRALDMSRGLNIPLIVARLLLSRGIADDDSARAFLDPKLTGLHDPLELRDMAKAVERVKRAVQNGERIAIHGDYDVDGATSTMLLRSFFELIGADVCTYIPNRLTEGYGLGEPGIQALAKTGARLVITVDNGISAVDEVRALSQLGLDTIITDHHEPGSRLPDALAIINPKQPGCQYPFKSLAGVGVAFKLAWALARELSGSERVTPEFHRFLVEALALVAVGTVVDVAPLVGENRLLVAWGLKALPNTPNPGLRALMETSRVDPETITAEDLAFRLGPRLNAAGRMGRADLAMQLLGAASFPDARKFAKQLNDANLERRAVERRIAEDAGQQLQARPGAQDEPAIVLASSDWHPGVIGIVAARLADRHFKPVYLVALSNGRGRGSARTIPAYPLPPALESATHLLTSHGGHAGAAGFSIPEENVDAFRDAMMDHAAKNLEPGDMQPSLDVDGELPLEDLSHELLDHLNRLQPFGQGNPEPLFTARDVSRAGPAKVVGRDGGHLKFVVRQGDRSLNVIAFNQAESFEIVENAAALDLAYRPQINNWQGRSSLELGVVAIRESSAARK